MRGWNAGLHCIVHGRPTNVGSNIYGKPGPFNRCTIIGCNGAAGPPSRHAPGECPNTKLELSPAFEYRCSGENGKVMRFKGMWIEKCGCTEENHEGGEARVCDGERCKLYINFCRVSQTKYGLLPLPDAPSTPIPLPSSPLPSPTTLYLPCRVHIPFCLLPTETSADTSCALRCRREKTKVLEKMEPGSAEAILLQEQIRKFQDAPLSVSLHAPHPFALPHKRFDFRQPFERMSCFLPSSPFPSAVSTPGHSCRMPSPLVASPPF